jgi:hypothetical protein
MSSACSTPAALAAGATTDLGGQDMDPEIYSNELLENLNLQSAESFDLKELEALCQPHIDALTEAIWKYTISHSKPSTEV